MSDYGHPLRFGVFITPAHGRSAAADPVALAVAAEEAGFDLVTFQDHPYQPTFYDTWTLLSFVAARTERVQLAGNVLNLPLRPPAVLARAVASLDLLSGGRMALGLGAGAFWDAIEAMGGPRRTPAEGVAALTEAIDVIRQIWDASLLGGVRVDGEFYRVRGAKRGPVPAHPVPLWLGAYKPRMLRLTATAADGWLPSQSYLKPGDLTRGNAVIDAAAREAGRDPAEIVRLLNIDSGSTADDLMRLATENGISTFIVAADDAGTIRRFAGEIAPRVRDLVASGRELGGIGAVAGTMRSAAARSRRHPGIAYDEVPAPLAARAVEPGDPGYARYTSSYLRGGAPGLVLRADSAEEVRQAIAFAREHRELPLGVFSAGHGISGRSLNNGGLVIDVGGIRHIDVADDGIVHMGPGARWVEVARALAPHGRAITSGDYGGVGVGGLATAGGVGLLVRAHGLTIDLLRSAELVLADGRIVRTSETEEPDLSWAIRGAGANFGIVTDFEFAAPEVGEVGFAQFVYDATDTAGMLERWGAAVEAAPRSVSGQILLSGSRPGPVQYAQVLLLVDESDPDAVIDALQPFVEVAPLLQQQVALTTYRSVLDAFYRDAPQAGQGEPRAHSGLAEHLTPELAAGIAELLEAGASYFFQIRAVGGAASDVRPDAMAYGWRQANFSLAAMGTARSGLDERWAALQPQFKGLYLSFETDTGPEVLARAFPPANLARLRVLKARYDPTGLFRDNFFIDPRG